MAHKTKKDYILLLGIKVFGKKGRNSQQCYRKISLYKEPTRKRRKEKHLRKNATPIAVHPSVEKIELLSSSLSSLSCESSVSSKSSVSSESSDSSGDEL